jgi:hypothetical protein
LSTFRRNPRPVCSRSESNQQWTNSKASKELVTTVVYSSILKMEVVSCFESSANFYRNTWHHISEGSYYSQRMLIKIAVLIHSDRPTHFCSAVTWRTEVCNLTVRRSSYRYIETLVSRNVTLLGVPGSAVVKALCYKPEGRWFDTR